MKYSGLSHVVRHNSKHVVLPESQALAKKDQTQLTNQFLLCFRALFFARFHIHFAHYQGKYGADLKSKLESRLRNGNETSTVPIESQQAYSILILRMPETEGEHFVKRWKRHKTSFLSK